MLFLGTGAAECYPDPFCDCDACRTAREADDPKLRRRRSSLLLNERNLIDCGPDIASACHDFGVSLEGLRNVFVTHTHCDHLALSNFDLAANSVTSVATLRMFLSRPAYDGLREVIRCLGALPHPQLRSQIEKIMSRCELIPINMFAEMEVDGMRVTALPGNHTGYFALENSLNYLFEKADQTLYYASDTGLFLPETLRYLENRELHILVIEGTFGCAVQPPNAGHLNEETVCQTLDQLTRQGTVTSRTEVLVTHIAHKGLYVLEDYERSLRQRYSGDISVAYDGMYRAF